MRRWVLPAAAALIVLALAATALAATRRGTGQAISTTGGSSTTDVSVVGSSTTTCRVGTPASCGEDLAEPPRTDAATTTTTAPDTTIAEPSTLPTSSTTTTASPTSTTTAEVTTTSESTTTTAPPGRVYGRFCSHVSDVANHFSCRELDGGFALQDRSKDASTDPLRIDASVDAVDGAFDATLPPGQWIFPRLTLGFRCWWTKPGTNFTEPGTFGPLLLLSGETVNMDVFCTDSSGG